MSSVNRIIILMIFNFLVAKGILTAESFEAIKADQNSTLALEAAMAVIATLALAGLTQFLRVLPRFMTTLMMAVVSRVSKGKVLMLEPPAEEELKSAKDSKAETEAKAPKVNADFDQTPAPDSEPEAGTQGRAQSIRSRKRKRLTRQQKIEADKTKQQARDSYDETR